jgi:hypothetical protein
MWDQASQDPDQRGGEVRRGLESGRGYGRAIDCAARRPDTRPQAAGHGRGVRETYTGETFFLGA